MGLLFVLIFWAVAGTLAAAVGAAILGYATAFLTRGVMRGRRPAIVAASLFPFVCLAWGGAVFVFQAAVNEGLLHRDLGAGDTWHAPLPNGYQVMMIDVTDQGAVYNPRTQPVSGVVGDREDAIFGVRRLQVADPYLIGTTDSTYTEHPGENTSHVDGYFILDMHQGKTALFQDIEPFQKRAREIGIGVKLEPIYTVYSKFRFTWFDVAAGVLFCVPLLFGSVLLIRWIMRLRRSRLLTGS